MRNPVVPDEFFLSAAALAAWPKTKPAGVSSSRSDRDQQELITCREQSWLPLLQRHQPFSTWHHRRQRPLQQLLQRCALTP